MHLFSGGISPLGCLSRSRSFTGKPFMPFCGHWQHLRRQGVAVGMLFLCFLPLGGPCVSLAADSTTGQGKAVTAFGPAGTVSVGSVLVWASEKNPEQTDAAGNPLWLEANGASFDAGLYPDLYKILKSSRLPDWRGLYLRGLGQNGSESGALSAEAGVRQEASIAAHGHVVPVGAVIGADASAAIRAAGTRAVTTTKVVTSTVTETADTSSLAAVQNGVPGTAEENAPASLFSTQIALWCDSRCQCFCSGSGTTACGDPGSWVSADGTLTPDLSAPDLDGAKVIAQAEYLDSMDWNKAAYTLWCIPKTIERTKTEVIPQTGSEEFEVRIHGAGYRTVSPAGQGAFSSTATLAGGSEVSGQETRPVSTAVRYFLRARP